MRNFALSMVALGTLAFLAGCGSSNTSTAEDSGTDGSSADGSPTLDSSTSDASEAGPNCHPVGVTQSDCRTCCAKAFPSGSTVFDNFTLACACGANYCGPLDGGAVDASGVDSGDAGAADAADAGAIDGGDAGLADANDSSDTGAGDAAATGGDSGPYGKGVCTATCNGTAAPDAVCNACILDTLGSVSSLGPCGSVVLGQCLGDAVCNAYFGCVETCP